MSDGTISRAGEPFEYGTEAEQAIKDIGLKFYNADGSFYGYGYPIDDPYMEGGTTENVESKTKNAVIVLNINRNSPKPVYVVAYANCGYGWKLPSEPNMNDIDQTINPNTTDEEGNSVRGTGTGYSMKYDETEYYSMTSSNYIEDPLGAITFRQGYQRMINPDKFKPTETDALAESVPVELYVERLAAKVKVSEGEGLTPEQLTNGEYTLDFVIDGYALGGVNTDSYYIKHIDSKWNATNLWTGWNNADYHRCFWAADMNYYETNVVPDLDYISYNEVKAKLSANKGNYMYCPENTQASFGDVSSESTNGALTAPRYTSADVNRYLFQEFAYVIGHYVVKKGGVEVKETTETIEGKEVKKNTYLYENAGKILSHDVMLTYMQNILSNALYTRKDGTGDAAAVYTSVNMAEKGWLDIGRYEKDASLVCLQLTDKAKTEIATSLNPENTDQNAKFYIKKQTTSGKDDSNYEQISSVDDVVKLLKQSEIQAYGFKYDETAGGYLAYFPILIKHLNTTLPDAKYGEDSRGYYGVVRNHIYNITINSIKGLGIGIFDPTVDIIPKDKIKPLYLAASFNVLSWRTVDQTVDL